jgi:hypothetical protein
MANPKIQINDVVREMTDAEYEDFKKLNESSEIAKVTKPKTTKTSAK